MWDLGVRLPGAYTGVERWKLLIFSFNKNCLLVTINVRHNVNLNKNIIIEDLHLFLNVKPSWSSKNIKLITLKQLKLNLTTLHGITNFYELSSVFLLPSLVLDPYNHTLWKVVRKILNSSYSYYYCAKLALARLAALPLLPSSQPSLIKSLQLLPICFFGNMFIFTVYKINQKGSNTKDRQNFVEVVKKCVKLYKECINFRC